MPKHLFPKLTLVVLLIATSFQASSQVAPAATSRGAFPLAVGAGFADYDVDWGHDRMEGGALWIDAGLNKGPSFLHGFGLEVEARDISLGRTAGQQPSNFREDTAGGGPIYTWRRYRNFHPYGKFIVGFGSIDFHIGVPNFNHDILTTYAEGGGIDYRIFKHVWARADFEYQAWPHFLGRTLDPQGFTVGAMYDFRGVNFH